MFESRFILTVFGSSAQAHPQIRVRRQNRQNPAPFFPAPAGHILRAEEHLRGKQRDEFDSAARLPAARSLRKPAVDAPAICRADALVSRGDLPLPLEFSPCVRLAAISPAAIRCENGRQLLRAALGGASGIRGCCRWTTSACSATPCRSTTSANAPSGSIRSSASRRISRRYA